MAIIVITVLLSLVTLLLIVRIYTRLRISKGFGLDDVFILLAYVSPISILIQSLAQQHKVSDVLIDPNSWVRCCRLPRPVKVRLGKACLGSSF